MRTGVFSQPDLRAGKNGRACQRQHPEVSPRLQDKNTGLLRPACAHRFVRSPSRQHPLVPPRAAQHALGVLPHHRRPLALAQQEELEVALGRPRGQRLRAAGPRDCRYFLGLVCACAYPRMRVCECMCLCVCVCVSLYMCVCD
jgi:hypothetical protein